MDARQRLFVALPDRWQLRIMALLGRLGLLELLPLFRMFARTLEFAGARPAEVRRALRMRGGFQRLASQAAAEAEQLRRSSDRAVVAAAYYRAVLYAISGCWGVHDPVARAERYQTIRAYVDRYAEAASPRAERLTIATEAGLVFALFRQPQATRGALILFPGSDQTKEWMAPFENYALERGLATLAIDLPGFGENGLSGAYLDSLDKLASICRALAAALRERLGPDTPLGAFGVSLGGLFALAAAGWEASIRASFGLGSPLRMGRGLRHIAAAQRDIMLAWSGADSVEELRRRFDPASVEAVVRRSRAPSLIVHGLADEVVPASDARALAELLGTQAELRLLERNDHMCTQALRAGAAHEWFDWLAQELARPRDAIARDRAAEPSAGRDAT